MIVQVNRRVRNRGCSGRTSSVCGSQVPIDEDDNGDVLRMRH
jgi:hypothetical protein